MKVRVLTTPRADHEARRETLWWRENRQAAPYLFEEELADAVDLLSEQPEAGRQLHDPGLEGIRLLVLQRTRYCIYYEHDATAAVVVIRAVWSAQRGRSPRVRPRR